LLFSAAKEIHLMLLRFCSLFVLTGAAAAFMACESNSAPPVSPSSLQTSPTAVVAGPAQLAVKGPSQHTVSLFDACDPQTFNAALGEGACTRSGGVRFDQFLEQLGRHHSIGAWHFAPSNVTMKVGELLVAINRGGETHTFTEVDEFGGGFVQQLNELTGLTEVAPECAALAAGGGRIAPGASSSEEEEDAGVEKYQCCIHPWMRAEVRIAAK
jgi:plastocyanin